MHTGRIVFRIISGLVLIGLLVLGGVLLYNAAWSQGYGSAQLTASANSAASGGQAVQPVQPAPGVYAPYYYGRPFYGPWFFGPLSCIFPILGILFFFFVLRMLFFSFFGWGWHRRHWMREGHMPPWWRDEPDESGKPGEGKPSAPDTQ